jgi:hypothetical protein
MGSTLSEIGAAGCRTEDRGVEDPRPEIRDCQFGLRHYGYCAIDAVILCWRGR